ncbi:MAG: hypothetical protein ACTSVE_01880 [Candidatus Helarchaeota archaeon]
MTILKGTVPDDINEKFRKIAMERFGYEKGAISKALTEAILKWIENQKDLNSNEEKQRLENNLAFNKMKNTLFQEHPNKYIVICNGKVAGVGDDLLSTIKKTKETHSDVKHCLIVKADAFIRRKARLGWRMKRIQKE